MRPNRFGGKRGRVASWQLRTLASERRIGARLPLVGQGRDAVCSSPWPDQKRIKAAFYRAVSGKEPARDWLLATGDGDRRTIGYDIATAESGWPIGMPTCRAMGKGLYEIRSNLAGNRISRVFFCVAEGHMVLLHGIIRKSQTTPKADIDLARTRVKEVSL